MYQKILVPLDGSELAECVLPHVKAIADGCRIGKVVLLSVVETLQVPIYDMFPAEWREDPKLLEKGKSAAEQYLKKVTGQMELGNTKIETQVLVGDVAENVARYASQNQVDLIAIATHGRSGVSRWFWGSTADKILRSACVPVLMVRAPGCVPAI